jgi:drug/metabolite transporter (DMT)-like permease
MTNQRVARASIGLIIGGVLWGTIWIPLRFLADYGIYGAWPGFLIYVMAAIFLLPLAVQRRASLQRNWRDLAMCGAFTGAAFSLYASSLLLTDVVRALLLFYLTPVWGTLLGFMFLNERLTVARVVAVATGIAGMLVVLGDGTNIPWPRNAGDVCALLAGVAWAYGTYRLYRADDLAIPDQVISFVAGSLVVTAGLICLGGAMFGPMPDLATMARAAPWALITGLYILPMLVLTIWPATILTPARVGLLLMSEVVVGVGSAAIWSGEPFGQRELIGSALILSAGLIEVLGPVLKPIVGRLLFPPHP